MCKKSLIFGSITLSLLPILNTSETVIKNQNNLSSKKMLFQGLEIIKQSILEIYQDNIKIFNQVKKSDQAFSLYKEILNDKKQYLQMGYEDKFESKWYWFGYWKWYATWNGIISTISDMTGAGIDAYQTWEAIQPALYTALLTYLGTAGAVPIIGWIMGGAAAALATSILSSIAGHQLWISPQREKGIIMTFYLVIYTGSWLQE